MGKGLAALVAGAAIIGGMVSEIFYEGSAKYVFCVGAVASIGIYGFAASSEMGSNPDIPDKR